MKKYAILALLLIALGSKLSSQIAGSFTVPGSFPTLAAAINTLNLTGVAGAVTINVLAGYTETVPVGGLKLINPPGSGTSPILFRKQGSGSDPLLLAYAGGTATSNSSLKDGIWMLVDCRNITIDGIDLIDPNTSTPSTMEYGYGFFRNGVNGSRNNTIRNCVITMAAPATFNAHGIEMTTSYYLDQTQTAAQTTSLATNSFNSFYSNLIQKCDIGIYITSVGSTSFVDQNNDIGGMSAVTGNTVVNFGGSSSFAQAIYAELQFQFNVSFNTINNNNGAGTTAISGVGGIYAYTGPDASINSNTISLSASGFYGSPLRGITQWSYGGSTGTVSINNNVFPSLSYTSTSMSVSSHVVISTASNNVTYVNNNQVGNFTTNSGTVNIITAPGGFRTFINNNTISGATVSADGIINGISASCFQLELTNNTLGNFLATATSTNASSVVYGINVPHVVSLSVSNNTITNLDATSITGMYFYGPVSTADYSITANRLTNFGTSPSNTIGVNVTGMLAGFSSSAGGGTVAITSNTLSNFTGKGFGTSLQSGEVIGIVTSYGDKGYVARNKIYDLFSSGSYGIKGFFLNSAENHVYNNLAGGFQVTANANLTVLDLNTGTNKVYFNSLYLNNTASPPGNFSSRLITSINSANIELRNNILVNTSVATGTGVTSIFLVNNILTASNRNSYYLGTVSPSRRLSFSVPGSTVLSGFQSVYNSDAQSFIENPPFISTVGASPNFLNINPGIATQIEGGAAAISTITTDFANTLRGNPPDVGALEGNYTAADITAPVVVSSGFTAPPCNGSSRTFTANLSDVSGVATGSLSPRVYYRLNFGLYTSTQGTLSSGTATNGVWTFSLSYAAATGDLIWYFIVFQDASYLNNLRIIPAAGANVSDVNNVSVPPNPASNYTIQTFPTISVAVNSATVCAGQPYVIQASGASSYSILPGNSNTVLPLSDVTYSVTGLSSLGCPSTNTVNVAVTTIPTPTINVNSGTICVGQSFVMVPGGATFYTYQGGSPVVSPSVTTSYTVIGQTSQGCTSLPVVSIVSVLSAGIGASASPDHVCSGGSVTLNASGGTNYVWSNSVTDNVPFMPPATLVYTVTGQSPNGCTGSQTVHVTVHGLPVITLSAVSAVVCVGEKIVVGASGAVSYQWQPNTQSGTTYTDTLQATTTVSVEGTDFFGCIGTATIELVADLCLGIPDLKDGIMIRVLPNPANGIFYIYSEAQAKELSVRVTDISGRVILQSALTTAQSRIDLSDHPEGVYLVEVCEKTAVISRTRIILVQH